MNLRGDALRWAWPLAAEAALALDDETEVTRLLDWLGKHPIGHIPSVLRAERLRIQARRLAGVHDSEAPQAFNSAIKALRELGSPYHLSKGLLDYARFLAATDDTHTAEQLAVEAGPIAERLRAIPLIQQARNLAGFRGGQQPTPNHEDGTQAALAHGIPAS